MNDKRRIRLVIETSLDPDSGATTYDTLEWFVSELYADLHTTAGSASDDSDSDASDGHHVTSDEEAAGAGHAGSDGGGGDALDACDDDAVVMRRIAGLKATSGGVIWAPSRNAYQVKSRAGSDKPIIEWTIPRKVSRDPRQMLKWLVATRKAIAHYQATGEVTKVSGDSLGDTDDDI
jgi:hypothetical protein